MNSSLACALIFLLSFCSLAYELLLAKVLSDLSQNEIFSQSLGIGCFLLGMGLGTGACSLWKTTRPLFHLSLIECSLAGLAFLVGPLAYLTGFLTQLLDHSGPPSALAQSVFMTYLIVGFLIFLIGFLSGFEFPLMMKAMRGESRYHLTLGFSYFGGLVAGGMVPLVLNPGWGPLASLQILGLFNFFLALFLLASSESKVLSRFAWLAIPSLAMIVGSFSAPHLEQAYLKTFYFKIRIPELNLPALQNIWKGLQDIPPVQRYHSSYQKIDFVRSSLESAWATDVRDGLTVYLDRRLQFNEATLHVYHESMTMGAFNLARRIPRRVLILGGGDGLLAAELLKYPEIERIDLVELDPQMIQLAQEHYDLLRFNRDSLRDPRVHVHVEDAFSFMKKIEPASVETVLIDFPYPHSPDLLRLYSFEFYSLVERALQTNGFGLLDGPLFSEAEMIESRLSVSPQDRMTSTLKEAGFLGLFVFGAFEGFYYFEKKPREIKFEYARLPERVSNAALVNMKSMNHLIDSEVQVPSNSIFRPQLILPSR